MSIFSELNNVTNVSMYDEYAGMLGITKEELCGQLSEDIEVLATKMHLTKEQTLDKLTENYDGYHFSAYSPDVFNPYSLFNCFAQGKLGSYWFASGTPTYLINMMRKYHVLPTGITRVEADESEFDAPTEDMTTMMPLLYQSGYLTIKDYNRDYNYYFHHLLASHRLSGRCRGAYSKGKGRCRFVDWNRFIHHRTET